MQTVSSRLIKIDQGVVDKGAVIGEQTLLESLRDESRPNLQVMALKTLPPEHESLSGELLQSLIQNEKLDRSPPQLVSRKQPGSRIIARFISAFYSSGCQPERRADPALQERDKREEERVSEQKK